MDDDLLWDLNECVGTAACWVVIPNGIALRCGDAKDLGKASASKIGLDYERLSREPKKGGEREFDCNRA